MKREFQSSAIESSCNLSGFIDRIFVTMFEAALFVNTEACVMFRFADLSSVAPFASLADD